MLLAGLVLVLGPGRDLASLASDDADTPVVQSPSAVEFEFVEPDEAGWGVIPSVDRTEYGYSVASAGDVDGNGGDDILVGAPKDESIDGKGAAYLYLSTVGGLSTTDAWTVHGGEWAVSFGSVVAGAGDVNGDGYDDAIIGDDQYRGLVWVNDELQRTKAGRAYVYAGVDGVGLSPDLTWSYTGTVQFGEFAYAVAGAGDLNDDGYDDIVVGARSYTDQEDVEESEGAVYVFFGSPSGPSTEPDWLIDSDQARARLGAAVSGAGDVNGDGYDDLIVGAPKYVNPETDAQEGAVFLFLGRANEAQKPTSVADAAWRAYGRQEESYFGTVVAGAGDVNGDGHPDVVVSSPWYYRPDEMQAGAAFAFCGDGSTFRMAPCWQVYGSQPGAQFGASAAGAGDVNGDGLDDVIVGAPTYIHFVSDDYHPEGAAFIYFGSDAGLSAWAGWRARGDKSRTDFGASVSSAGDVNGDYIDDVIIGAPQYFKYESTPYGAAFCFYGPLEPSGLEPVVFLPLVMRNAD